MKVTNIWEPVETKLVSVWSRGKPVDLRRRAPFHFVPTYATRTDGYYQERNDCTVRALMVAGNMRYCDAHSIMSLGGRSFGQGANVRQGLQAGADLGMISFEDIDLVVGVPNEYSANPRIGLFRPEELLDWNCKSFTIYGQQRWRRGRYVYGSQPRKRVTLGMVLKKIPTGRYILCTLGHAFAVIDGVVHDSKSIGLTAKILLCYRVYPGGQDGQSHSAAKTK